ncbi:MAG: leucyl aminopeptidase family protein [Alphaproteobacteria bacterium]|nr:leucyl aminopeptidase family protein [Alphaproteobacteria bacterium]
MPLSSQVTCSSDPSSIQDAAVLVVIGRKARLQAPSVRALVPVSDDVWDAMLGQTDGGDGGASASSWAGACRVIAGVLPEPCSRHNSPSRAWAIPALAREARGGKDAAIVLALDHADHATAAALAAARAFPRYDATTGEARAQTVTLLPLGPDGPVDVPGLQAAIDGVREAAWLVDQPTSELHTDAFVEEARQVAGQVGAAITVLRDDELHAGGFGGLWGVGKAAVHKPALVVLDHNPPGATRTWAWVGKGIVYDTGGLSIKGKTTMPGMKCDMGGAAAVLGAFQAAATRGTDVRILAVLCLAENAVGPESTRPDDILHMHSGKTVEVNNTDAEGRLVLSDGLSWVMRTHKPDRVADLATLTGAVLVAVGRVHAGIYANDEALERDCVAVGRRVGEPVHPLLYAPELLRKEFRSEVADMKNSVKDRSNAQSSCAAQFIANHLPDDPPPWVHIDIAGTAWDHDYRGTGYGVGLLLGLLET